MPFEIQFYIAGDELFRCFAQAPVAMPMVKWKSNQSFSLQSVFFCSIQTQIFKENPSVAVDSRLDGTNLINSLTHKICKTVVYNSATHPGHL